MVLVAYEKGGRADKLGNRFEYNWILYNLLQVIEEKIQYVMIEAIGEDEDGVDLWIGNLDGSREGQQCKGRYGSDDKWTYGTINTKKIWEKWKKQLAREEKVHVSLVSPLSFPQLEDLTGKARNTNGNPKDFYNYQIDNDNVSKDVKQFYKNYCSIMDIDCSNEAGILQSIDYLSRTFYRQRPDFELKNMVLDKIYMLFVGEPLDIYSNLLELILTEDIFAKNLDVVYLENYLSACGAEYRNLAKDKRIFPRVKELNDEYSRSFISFQKGIITRHEFKDCKKMIEMGQSFIIHGNAGTGKSGCTENIINFCNQEQIPYLSIKLDKRIPKNTAENWGISMGLPASPALCIDAISKNKMSILIFDQLDALRWTQAHSGNALDVCMQTIKEVGLLNKSREYKICFIFVTRTYDLLNDRGIKQLFDTKSEQEEFKWKKIKIGELNEEDVKLLVGSEFSNLTQKTKKMLAIPSNMYIWQHLNDNADRLYMDTTRQLVNEWWKQIQLKAEEINLDSRYLVDKINDIVSFCYDRGRINAPNSVIQIPIKYIDFLQSSGFLYIVNEIISFTHQSILDVFLSNHMVKEYYAGKDIVAFIGNKDRQLPGRRYELQLFMEQMIQDSEKDFLDIGDEILKSIHMRFSFKFVFLESLSIIDSPSKKICNYVCQMADDAQWGKYFVNNVILGNKSYIDSMQDTGKLEEWLNSDNKGISIQLYGSISHSLEKKHFQTIRKYIFQDEDMLDEWSRCFSWQISEDSDELFDLRMQFYEKYPKYLDSFFIDEQLFKKCEMRTVRLLELMLKEKVKNHGKRIYKLEEEFIYEDAKIIVTEYEKIIKTFLPLLPDVGEMPWYGDWSARYSYHIGIERACVQILKKANVHLASIEPEKFWNIYDEYMFVGNDLYNEIILDGLYYLPEKYSDKIVEYLCADFNTTMFEQTSGNYDRLLSGKKLLEKVSRNCSEKSYDYLEQSIIKFIDKDAVDRLRERIECNRNQGNKVYWRFWGDFQRECLKMLPKERLSVEALQLVIMFLRNEVDYASIYEYSDMEGGGVSSPIANKTISYAAWKHILTNSEIPVHSPHRFKKVDGCFIEATQTAFASSLENVIKKEGIPFLEYILSIELPISNVFIQSIYSAIACSEQLDNIDTIIIEKLIEKFGYDYDDYRAMNIIRIFEKKENANWSEEALAVLHDIALNHKNPELGKPNITPQQDKEISLVESIESNAINSVRGRALEAIAALIWEDDKMADKFMEPIKIAIKDSNPVMRYASQFALWPIYNINRQWASEQIISLYENDVRMAGFRDGKGMLLRLYENYHERVIDIVKKMFISKDKRLIKISGYTIAELYMLHDECKEIVVREFEFSKEQKEAVLEMLVVYVGVEKYREKAKIALIHNVDDFFNMEFPWIRLFYGKLVDLDKDEEFINAILSSVIGRRVLGAFINFLKESQSDLKSCKNIVLQMCFNLIELGENSNQILWIRQNEISKLVISLYDAYSDDLEDDDGIAMKCLDIWDAMYEKQIGMARELTKSMMDM